MTQMEGLPYRGGLEAVKRGEIVEWKDCDQDGIDRLEAHIYMGIFALRVAPDASLRDMYAYTERLAPTMYNEGRLSVAILIPGCRGPRSFSVQAGPLQEVYVRRSRRRPTNPQVGVTLDVEQNLIVAGVPTTINHMVTYWGRHEDTLTKPSEVNTAFINRIIHPCENALRVAKTIQDATAASKRRALVGSGNLPGQRRTKMPKSDPSTGPQ